MCEDIQADVEDGQLQFFYILAFVLQGDISSHFVNFITQPHLRFWDLFVLERKQNQKTENSAEYLSDNSREICFHLHSSIFLSLIFNIFTCFKRDKISRLSTPCIMTSEDAKISTVSPIYFL